MSRQQNIAIAQKELEGIGGGQDPAKIAALFDTDLLFEIQDDVGASLGHRLYKQMNVYEVHPCVSGDGDRQLTGSSRPAQFTRY